MQTTSNWTPDASQARIIALQQGHHLVLAPPGCGKTQILTERIQQAHRQGLPYRDMLCLTFTNRAARGMAERIDHQITDEDRHEIYVGNIHRFCSRFLFENGLVPSESSIIDDDDPVSILTRYTGDDECRLAEDIRRRRGLHELVFLSHLVHQIKHKHPKNLRLHADCISEEDVKAMRKICEMEQTDFTPQALIRIYEQADIYESAAQEMTTDYATQCILLELLRKMTLARQYEQYKKANKLLDFEDLLLLTYDALSGDQSKEYRRYSWIQVDEVQDLNPLQLAIVDAITAESSPTVMYLGDEQQAIFSFMGAQLHTLSLLRARCGDNVHHLAINHRSPKYLLDVFNAYACEVLHVDANLLPTADNHIQGTGNELQMIASSGLATELENTARLASILQNQAPQETTAIIVSANRDADEISSVLRRQGLAHFKVSGEDLFATPEVKLLFAHLNLLSNPHNFIAWARLLKGLHIFEGNTAARNFVQSLFRCSMSPADLLEFPDGSYIENFIHLFDTREIVIFDTETTGLNVFEDDIVQIAAVKMRNGQVVPGSRFNVFIATERPVPQLLGSLPNPILQELTRNPLLPAAEALRQFMQYAGNGVLLGHNADYDYHILDHNLRRYCPDISLEKQHPTYLDSLRIIRLLQPHLRQYKLKALLETLQLEGENSHLADEDVMATVSLTVWCYARAQQVVPLQRAFLAKSRVQECANALRKRYSEPYFAARSRLYIRLSQNEEAALVQELKSFRRLLSAEGLLQPVKNLNYIYTFLQADLLDVSSEPSLVEQLSNHILEINTLKEADLCSSHVIDERIFVTTVHKAKGLEFDNIILFDAIDSRYPNYYTQSVPRLFNEEARRFYVAITRARRRLFVLWSLAREGFGGTSRPNQLTRFMTPILHFFTEG